MATPTFPEFAEFVREFAGIPRKMHITPATRFEKDLGITGDDGVDLLEETEKRFGAGLSSPEYGVRQTFTLRPNEYLFHAEGSGLFGLFCNRDLIREFTVGELFDAVWRTQSKDEQGRA